MWIFVIQLIIGVALMVISILLMPKTKEPESPKPGEFSFPLVTRKNKIPVLFGVRRQQAPNVVYYGEIGTRPNMKCS